LFIFTQPGHLQKIERRILEPEERDGVRAEFIRRKLDGL
jgi:protein-arginine kinase